MLPYLPPAQLVLNHSATQAVLDGMGIVWVPELSVAEELADGRIRAVLPECAMTFDPLYLYYPSRKGNSTVFRLLVEALRWRG